MRRSSRGGRADDRGGKGGNRDRDVGPGAVAQLAKKVSEGASVAVPADHEATPVVVAEEFVPPRGAVADVHRVVPRDGNHGGDDETDAEREPKLAVFESPGEPVRAERPDGDVRGDHHHGQRKPGESLGQDRKPRQGGRRCQRVQMRLLRAQQVNHHARGPQPVGSHRDDAVHREIAVAPGHGDPQVDGIDEQLRHGRHQEQRDAKPPRRP